MSKAKREQFRASPPVCVYCSGPADTRDHVIPEGIFDVLDLHMITVPACFACNQAKKQYDEILRDLLIVDLRTKSHPVALTKFWGEFCRATKNHQSELARRIVEESEEHDIVKPDGLYLGQVATFEVGEDLDAEMRLIVRGLTAHHLRQRVDPASHIRVGLVDKQDAQVILDTMTDRGSVSGIHALGGDVVNWVFQYCSPNHSIWLFCFYARLFLSATVVPAGHELGNELRQLDQQEVLAFPKA